MTQENYCCPMRRYFVLGVVAQRAGESAPVDVVDYLESFEGPPVLRIRFCPFCGKKLDLNETLRTLG